MAEAALAETEEAQTPSLVDVIRSIEAVPDYANVNRQTAMRQAFERWAENYALVRDVRDGRTTFSGEYEELFGHHDGTGLLYPHLQPTEVRQERVRDAYAVIGGEELYAQANRYNPVTGIGAGILGAGMMVGTIAAGAKTRQSKTGQKVKLSRRELLETVLDSGKLIGMGGVVGGIAGTLFSLLFSAGTEKVQQNAAYLDTKIEEAYK